jgi:hypothetical protein
VKPDDGRTWEYKNSSTSTLRHHIEKYHADEYIEACNENGWEVAIASLREKYKQMHATKLQATREAFTTEGLLKRLVHWITADDQVHTLKSYRRDNVSVLTCLLFEVYVRDRVPRVSRTPALLERYING